MYNAQHHKQATVHNNRSRLRVRDLVNFNTATDHDDLTPKASITLHVALDRRSMLSKPLISQVHRPLFRPPSEIPASDRVQPIATTLGASLGVLDCFRNKEAGADFVQETTYARVGSVDDCDVRFDQEDDHHADIVPGEIFGECFGWRVYEANYHHCCETVFVIC